jgi:hypothetical protein
MGTPDGEHDDNSSGVASLDEWSCVTPEERQ